MTDDAADYERAHADLLLAEHVIAGSTVWNPLTDWIGNAASLTSDQVAYVTDGIATCLRDTYSGPRPGAWTRLEPHYRQQHPRVWPPSTVYGDELSVTSAYDHNGVRTHIVIQTITPDPTDTLTIQMFEVRDAYVLARLLAQEINSPKDGLNRMNASTEGGTSA